ncbi:hypothetical protein A5725_17520 [Mycobacterium kubicae]|nr:hypothetical protein A5725_17520 [Mycobacterium kubicae]
MGILLGGMLGIGDMDGMLGPIGIFMFFMSSFIAAQQSCFAAFMPPQQSEGAKNSKYTPATTTKIPTAMPVIARAW